MFIEKGTSVVEAKDSTGTRLLEWFKRKKDVFPRTLHSFKRLFYVELFASTVTDRLDLICELD